MKKIKLKFDEDKSKIVSAFDESFDFLAHTFRFDNDVLSRKFRKYWNLDLSSKSQTKVRDKMREYLVYNGHKPLQEI